MLVILHELGHFILARRAGVEVEEFGIGFPPRAKILTKKNGTTFTLNWLPLGGFVKLKGEHDSDETPGSFGAAKLKDKVNIMLAGVVVNFITAFVIFTFLALVGMPKLLDNQFTVANDNKVVRQDVLVGYVEDGSPANSAGLQERDILKKISAVNKNTSFELTRQDQLKVASQALAGEQVNIEIVRAGKLQTVTATMLSEQEVEASKQVHQVCISELIESDRDCPTTKGFLGVIPGEYVVQRATWSAPVVGAAVTGQFTQATLRGLGSIVGGLFKGDTTTAKEQVSGVVGVGFILSDSSFLGPIFMIMIIGVISLSLAVMNLLPIPALDGGRLFVTLLYRLFKKPLSKTTEERIHGTGFAILMLLFVLITVLDVQKFIL